MLIFGMPGIMEIAILALCPLILIVIVIVVVVAASQSKRRK